MAMIPTPPAPPTPPGKKSPPPVKRRVKSEPLSGHTMPIRVSEKNIGRMK